MNALKTINLGGGLSIYRVKNTSKWHMRLYKDKREIRKTTKESDINKATKFAIIQQAIIENNIENGIEIGFSKNQRVKTLFNELVEGLNRKQGQDKQFYSMINNHILPFLENERIKDFDQVEIDELLERSTLTYSKTQIANFRTCMKNMFYLAVSKRCIKSYEVPVFKMPKAKKEVRRLFFKKEEIKEIFKMENWLSFNRVTNNRKSKRARTKLITMMYLVLNTGCRPGTETNNIKFGSFEKIEDDYYLNIKISKVKKERKIFIHKQIIREIMRYEYFDNSDYIAGFEKLIEYKKNEYLLRYSDNNIIEFSKIFSKYKNHLKLTAGIEIDNQVYSFRHTFITNMLFRGESMENIALTTGTSIQMVEKFYNHLESLNVSKKMMDFDLKELVKL